MFLKGYRCYTPKCSFEKRNVPPGQHGGHRRSKVSNYGLQLREKQKVRRTYGLMEKQFRRTFERAERLRGVTGENLLSLLERRLDTIVLRAGFASSQRQARQLVNHGHIMVNGRRVDIPSYTAREGDVISVREKSKSLEPIQAALEAGREVPGWLEVDRTALSATVRELPRREHIKLPVQEQLIVELYSR